MSRRWWWAAGVVAVVAAVTVGLWDLLGDRDSRDSCAAIRDMIAVNQQHTAQVDSQSAAGVQPVQAEYEQWANRLGDLAAGVDDPQLSPRARRMADLAHQSVVLNSAVLAELSAPQPAPGLAANRYAELNQQFVAEQSELARACPA